MQLTHLLLSFRRSNKLHLYLNIISQIFLKLARWKGYKHMGSSMVFRSALSASSFPKDRAEVADPYNSHPSTSTPRPVPHAYHQAPTANIENTEEARVKIPSKINLRTSETVRGEVTAALIHPKGTVTLHHQLGTYLTVDVMTDGARATLTRPLRKVAKSSFGLVFIVCHVRGC